ncbi:MAG: PilZ domain-containing protein [Myxococcota bacterium]
MATIKRSADPKAGNAKPASPPAPKGPRLGPELDSYSGPEHRQFPRAKMMVPFRLAIGEGEDVRFQATLSSANVSVSGAFLESTFFLPIGTEVRASFVLDPEEDPVLARAEIVRQETPNREGKGRSGFALRFVEFFQQSEVTLAKLFLGARLKLFAEGYLASKRARSLGSELERCVDALAAWELKKVTSSESPWGESTA